MFNITVIQVHAPTIDASEAEVDHFCEDQHDLLELTPKKCSLHHRGLDAKVGTQEIPRVPGKFGLGVQNEVGQD